MGEGGRGRQKDRRTSTQETGAEKAGEKPAGAEERPPGAVRGSRSGWRDREAETGAGSAGVRLGRHLGCQKLLSERLAPARGAQLLGKQKEAQVLKSLPARWDARLLDSTRTRPGTLGS